MTVIDGAVERGKVQDYARAVNVVRMNPREQHLLAWPSVAF
jgi:hypothetical protein